jgi:hypothetical protein
MNIVRQSSPSLVQHLMKRETGNQLFATKKRWGNNNGKQKL